MSEPATIDGPALVVAMATAALAGATDVYGLVRLHDLFVSFMSGNTTSMAVALAGLDWPRVGLIAGLLALFVGGAAVGAALSVATRRWHAPAVMTLVTALLAMPLLHDPLAVPALTMAMGALNGTMARIGDTSVGLTYVTGAIVKFGSGVGRWAVGVREPRHWLLHGPIWLSLFGGGVAGALLSHRLGAHRFWPLPLFAALLVPVLAFWAQRESAAK